MSCISTNLAGFIAEQQDLGNVVSLILPVGEEFTNEDRGLLTECHVDLDELLVSKPETEELKTSTAEILARSREVVTIDLR